MTECLGFDDAFERLIGHEGVYSKDSRDRGNWTGGKVGVGELKGTKWGISAAQYPDENIPGLTIERAKQIYRRDYWAHIQGDQLPAWIAFHVFDAAVNSDPETSVRWLQRAVGARPDGILGAQTIACARRADPGTALARFNGHRLGAMTDMSTWADHGRGWARRIARNLVEV